MEMRISLETGFFIEISFDHLNMIKTTFKAVYLYSRRKNYNDVSTFDRLFLA